jgi:hypothetical protein
MNMEPELAQKVVEAIADAICPRWRKDAVVSDSRPSRPIKGGREKVLATAENFWYWTANRSNASGLVKMLEITWGSMAMHYLETDHKNEVSIYPSEHQVPILVKITLDRSKVAVEGTRTGSTRGNMKMEVWKALFNTWCAANRAPNFTEAVVFRY